MGHTCQIAQAILEMNGLVAKSNGGMKEGMEQYGGNFEGDHSVRQMDLKSDVHLNEMRMLKLQRKLCCAIWVASGLPYRVVLFCFVKMKRYFTLECG